MRAVVHYFQQNVALSFQLGCLLVVKARLRNFQPRALGKQFYRLHKVDIFHFAHEFYYVARFAAAEAVIILVSLVYGKRRGFFMVKRATCPKAVAAPFERNIIPRNFNDIEFVF